MQRPPKLTQKPKATVLVAIIGLSLAWTLHTLHQPLFSCDSLDTIAWLAFHILQPLVQSLPAYLHVNSSCFNHLLQIVAFAWPLAGTVAG